MHVGGEAGGWVKDADFDHGGSGTILIGRKLRLGLVGSC